MDIAKRAPILALAVFILIAVNSHGSGSAFTYQGRLNNAGNPANGSFDFAFSLFDTNNNGTQIANTITNSDTAVSNGLFLVALDFGGDVFTGINLWLEISVRSGGSNVAFATLSPRQPILATPYSIYAQVAGSIAPGVIGVGIPNIKVFTNSGVFNVPLGVSKIMVEVWGGGAGGGGGDNYASGGGGGGGFGKDVFTVTSGTDYTITVGNGGTAGQNGGSTSFGSLISASGGSAGGSARLTSGINYAGVGGNGGTSSANFNSAGAQGSGGAIGSALNYYLLTGHQAIVAGGAGGAAGGAGSGGGGGTGNVTGNGGNGSNGSAPGGGGGGGGEGSGGVSRGGVGGNGGDGRVVVYW